MVDTLPDMPNNWFLQGLVTQGDTGEKADYCVQTIELGTDSGPGLPKSVTKIDIQKDTCEFTMTSPWGNTQNGAIVGKLTCNKWADAKCYTVD
jgi:hypothetical protein